MATSPAGADALSVTRDADVIVMTQEQGKTFAESRAEMVSIVDHFRWCAEEAEVPTSRVLCADGPVRSLPELTLVGEHRRGHGAMYDALACGRIEPRALRPALAALPVPKAVDGRIVLAVDVSPWLRSDAPTSAERLFCHVYGRGRGNAQMIPGWPYSFVAALEPGRTSWTAMLDVVRIGPGQDATAVTAIQLRGSSTGSGRRVSGGRGTRRS